MDEKSQKPGEPDILKKPDLLNPALLFLVLLIPLVVAVFIGLQGPAPQKPVPAPVAAVADNSPKVVYDRRLTGEGRKPRCGFQDLVGKAPDQSVVSRIQEAGKTYRLVPPGGQVTMDYSPRRITLELDDRGVIRRVTCG